MKLSIKVQLTYSEATQIIASIEAAHSSDQKIISEVLNIQPPIQLLRDEMSWGDRRIRASLFGEVTIQYEASVENNLRLCSRQPGASMCGPTCPLTFFHFCCQADFVLPTNSCDLLSENSVLPTMALRVSCRY